MTQTPPPPAGWYPQGDQERWWDGVGWSDNFRPLGSEQTVQPGGQPYDQPYDQTYGQPGYGQPGYGQAYAPPAQKSHLARNILIVFAVLFLLVVGGCVALVAVVGKEVNEAVNDDSLGGPNKPLTITEGQGFEVDGFEYADGWEIVDAPVSGLFEIAGLQLTNNRDEADRLLATISLLDAGTVVASATCIGGDYEKIPRDITVTVDCSSTDPLPPTYDQVTIKDSF